MEMLLIPLVLVVGLVVIMVLWAWTNLIVALFAFAGLCSLAAWLYDRQRRKNRGLPPGG